MSEGWSGVLLLIGCAFMLWWMIYTIRRNPQSFSKENLGKSFYTIGIVALIIIAVVFFCAMLLRTT